MMNEMQQPSTHSDPSHAFTRARRVVKTDEFSSVFNLRPVFRTAHFVLYVRPNGLPQARLGVVAAKRLAPRAITRNTVKRMTREQFRQLALPAIDCIVRLSKPVNARKGPATGVALRRVLKGELLQLFQSQCGGAGKGRPPARHAANAASTTDGTQTDTASGTQSNTVVIPVASA